MSIVTCWSAKGGSGTTVVAAGVALSAAEEAVLVDLAGELPLALGVPEPAGQGLAEWFSSDAAPASVADLAVDVNRSVRLVSRGAGPIARDDTRWPELAAWMADDPRTFVVDAGVGAPPDALRAAAADDADVRDVLVTRPCYLAIQRARALSARPGGIVLVDDNGGSLHSRDISVSLGAPVVATVPIDPAVGRAVNAGLLASGVPASLRRALRALGSTPGRAAPSPHRRRMPRASAER